MKNYKFLIPIALIAVFACSIYMKFSTNIEKSRLYETNLQAARESRELGVWVDAEKYYKEALSYGESAELRVEIGQMYVEALQSGKAVEWGQEANAKYPKEISVYEFLSDTYLGGRDYAACFQVYDQMQKLGLQSEAVEETIASIEYEYYQDGQYADAGIYSGGLCAVKTGESWGYTNLTGKEVIKPKYAYAGPYASGVAPVIDFDGDAYFIDENGNKKIVVENVEQIEMLGLIENNLFSLYDGKSVGFYHPNGEMVFGGYEEATSIGNGVAAVKTDGKWCIVDSQGTELSSERYDGVVQDEKGVICRNDRIFVEKTGYYYLIDSKGNRIGEQKFEAADPFNGSGYAAVQIEGLWGFVDTEGKVVIDPEYEEAKSFSNGYAAVKKGNAWGYIDIDNKLVIPAQFEGAMDFNSSGAAYIKEYNSWKLIVLYKYNH